MRLHIALDEKVIGRCIRNFERVFPGQNKFIIIMRDRDLKYVSEDCCIPVHYGTSEFWKKVGSIEKYESVIIHSFFKESIDFVLKINHHCIYWIEWGADLYDNLLAVKGYKLHYEKDIDWRMSHVRLPYLLYRVVKWCYLKHLQHKQIKAIKKVRYFVPDSMYDEYPLLLKYYPSLNHLEYKEFFYYPIDEVVDIPLFENKTVGDNIIVGNSSSVTANHLLVFQKLNSFNLDKAKILVPLSYGNSKLRDYVKTLGFEMWKENFVPIETFLPLNEYNNVLQSAKIFIFGNWRQEAVGNILAALYIGGKVFLDSRNPLLDYYERLGLYIYDLSSLSEKELSTKLSEEEVAHNRNILKKIYSKERQLQLIERNF